MWKFVLCLTGRRNIENNGIVSDPFVALACERGESKSAIGLINSISSAASTVVEVSVLLLLHPILLLCLSNIPIFSIRPPPSPSAVPVPAIHPLQSSSLIYIYTPAFQQLRVPFADDPL